jgi:hypothetical protein
MHDPKDKHITNPTENEPSAHAENMTENCAIKGLSNEVY